MSTSHRCKGDRPDRHVRESGQALVDFALVFPLFVVMLMALLEFTFVLNGQLSINFATRDAALIGAEASNAVGADCVILQKVEQDVTAPADKANITQAQIFRTNSNGQPLDTSGNVTTFGSGSQAANTYTRTGSTTCTFSDGTQMTVPYSLAGSAAYPESSRCNAILGTAAGCQAGHPGLDTIGVLVVYTDTWRTPLHTLLGMMGSGWTLTQSNEMRMEPVL